MRARPRAGVVCRARRRGGSCEPAPPPLPASGDAPRRAAAAPPGSRRRESSGPHAASALPAVSGSAARFLPTLPARPLLPAPPPAPARRAPPQPETGRLLPPRPAPVCTPPHRQLCAGPQGRVSAFAASHEVCLGAPPSGLLWGVGRTRRVQHQLWSGGNQKTRGREWQEEVRTPDGIPKLREPRDRQLPFPWEEGGARRSQAGNPDGRLLVLLRPWTDSRPQATCLVSAFGFSRRGMQGLD